MCSSGATHDCKKRSGAVRVAFSGGRFCPPFAGHVCYCHRCPSLWALLSFHFRKRISMPMKLDIFHCSSEKRDGREAQRAAALPVSPGARFARIWALKPLYFNLSWRALWDQAQFSRLPRSVFGRAAGSYDRSFTRTHVMA